MTFEKVKEVIVDTINCDADKVTLEASLSDDLEIDSLDSVDMVMALEEELDITIPDEALVEMKTVEDIVNYIDKESK